MARRRTRAQSRNVTCDKKEERSQSFSKSQEECNTAAVQASLAFSKHTLTPIKIFATDNLDASQAEVCEVEWDSRSPITLTQAARYKKHSADITELVRNYTEERDHPSCASPLHGLWMDTTSDTDDGLCGVRYRVHKFRRGQGLRGRGRPSGIKAAVSSKEMLLQLASVLETKPEEDVCEESSLPENQTRKSPRLGTSKPLRPTEPVPGCAGITSEMSFDLFESTTYVLTSTQKDSSLARSKPATMLEEDITDNQTKGTVVMSTPSRPSRSAVERLRSPAAPTASPNRSIEDLWTDEDIFEDDSFIIKATQGEYDSSATVTRTPLSRKRKAPYGSPCKGGEDKKVGGPSCSVDLTKKDKVNFQLARSPELPFKSYFSQRKGSLASSPLGKPEGTEEPGGAGAGVSRFRFVRPQSVSTCSLQPQKRKQTHPLQQLEHRSSEQKENYEERKLDAVCPSTVLKTAEKIAPSLELMKPSKGSTSTLSATVAVNRSITAQGDDTRKDKQAKVHVKPPGREPCSVTSVSVGGGEGDVSQRKLSTYIHKSAVSVQASNRHSTPLRRKGPTSGIGVMDTSISEELLASLAEPDDLLDSQLPQGHIELVDSQVFREHQSLSPEGEGHLPLPVNDANTNGLHSINPTSSQVEPIVNEDNLVNELMEEDEDDELSEPQLLAILDLVESQVSQGCKKDAEPAVTHTLSSHPMAMQARGSRVNSIQPTELGHVAHRQTLVGSCNVPSAREMEAPSCGGVALTEQKRLGSVPSPQSDSAPGGLTSSCSTSNKEPSVIMTAPGQGIHSTLPTEGATSQKYTKEDIERKKQEAIRRRQSRLKLAANRS